jgi:hypothetical protein
VTGSGVPVPAGRSEPGELRRVLVAARVQLVPWAANYGFEVGRLDGVALVLVPSVFAVSILLGLPLTTLGFLALLCAGHWRTVTQVLPFALDIGITRRAFHLATMLIALVEGVVLGTSFTALAQLERLVVEPGPGRQVIGIGALSAVELLAVYTALFLASAVLGAALGAVSARGGPGALLTVAVAVVVVSALVAGLGVGLGWWTAAAAFLAGVPVLVPLALAPLVLAALLGVTGFAVLRRATA